MDINTLITAISSVGFPICCCCACFWYINKTTEELRKTIENNTNVMNKIIAKLDIKDDI